MSTAAPPVTPQQVSPAEAVIDERIVEAQRALWWSELTRTALKVVIGSMLAVLGWLVIDHWVYSPGVLARTIVMTADRAIPIAI